MSENGGEFKKIICGFLERTIRDTPTAKKLMIDVVAEVFDNAKKEFPVHPDHSADVTIWVLEVDDWLQKWFGK